MISDFRATLDFSRVTASESVQDLRICVCVRKRPINKKGNFRIFLIVRKLVKFHLYFYFEKKFPKKILM